MINELDALRKIEGFFNQFPKDVTIGIGDDTAAIRTNGNNLLLATTDSQVEDVHFIRSAIRPEDLARKSVAVSVSDIGAMGGVAKYFLATVGFSDQVDEGFLQSLMDGFRLSETEFGVNLIGGNVTSSNKVFIDITVLGEVEPELVVKRKGALPGDLIYVSGTVGDSALGLKILQSDDHNNLEYLIRRHLAPEPRLDLGRQLAVAGIVTSMIDVSDGLILDLERITIAQSLGARLFINKVPVSSEYNKHVSEYASDYYQYALSGGEDYELLFTSPEDKRNDITKLSNRLGTQITEIGYITSDNTLKLLDTNGEETTVNYKGFVHLNS